MKHCPRGGLIGLVVIGLLLPAVAAANAEGLRPAMVDPSGIRLQSVPPASSSVGECLARPEVTVLSGTYTERVKISSPPDELTVDARDGVSLSSGLRALEIGTSRVSDGGCFVGWSVYGQQSRTLTRRQMHDDIGGSALRVYGSNYVVNGLRAENVEDAFDPRGGEGFEVRNMWTEYIRDDCIENDERRAGIVSDSLFDGCYTFFSEQEAGTVEGESLIFDKVLVHLLPMPGPHGTDDPSILGHGSFFKRFDNGGRHQPVIRDSVFFLEDDCYSGCDDWPPGTTASNVTIVWVGSGEFPMSVLPGMTLTTDRSVWDEAAADWKQRHGCTTIDQPCTRLHDPGLGLVFVPVTACAVFDTRPAQGGAGAFGAGETRSFDVVGGSVGCPQPVPAAAGAVFLNMVAVTPAGSGELVVAPQGEVAGGSVVPYQAFSPNMNNSNAVPMGLVNGSVDVTAGGAGTEVRGVVLGYWVDPVVESNGLVFSDLNPCAVFDTRPAEGGAGALGPNDMRTFDVMGAGCGIPVEAEALFLNLVAVTPAGGGNLKIAAQGVPPQGGVVNYQSFSPNLNNSNAIVVPLNQAGVGGQVDVYTNGFGSEVRGVVLGYFTSQAVSPDGQLFYPTLACQAFDSRLSQGGAGPIPGNTSRAYDITGSGCGIPTDADAVFLNLQARDPLGGGNLKVAAQGVPPQGGVVNYQVSVDNANAIIVELNHAGVGGQIDVWTNGQGSDVGGVPLGYYKTPTP